MILIHKHRSLPKPRIKFGGESIQLHSWTTVRPYLASWWATSLVWWREWEKEASLIVENNALMSLIIWPTGESLVEVSFSASIIWSELEPKPKPNESSLPSSKGGEDVYEITSFCCHKTAGGVLTISPK